MPTACWLMGAARSRGRRDPRIVCNREGRTYFIVTNDASKLPATAAARFQGFGLPIDASALPHVGHAASRAILPQPA